MRLTTERLELTPFDRERDWPDFVTHLVLDPVVTRYWADFADPSLADVDEERLATQEFLPWFEEGRVRGFVAWIARTPPGGMARGSPPRRAGPCWRTLGFVSGWIA